MDYDTEKIIVRCPGCKQKLRLPLFQDKKLLVTCPKCRKEFRFEGRKYVVKQKIRKQSKVLLAVILIIADIVIPFVLVSKAKVVISSTESNYRENVEQMEAGFVSEIAVLKEKYTGEIAKIDRDKLKERARIHYAKIWQERENYDSRFAMTPRERAKLEMLALAKDKNKSVEQILRSIAEKASPKNSQVDVNTTNRGLELDVEFDMSELTSGEKGSRTKHTTVDSLRKEVVILISRVTNDVYEFCRDIDLETISIGCRHFVKYDHRYGSLPEENITLYRIRLDKKDIRELKHDYFLDFYSTRKYFKVVEDNFASVYIEQMYEK